MELILTEKHTDGYSVNWKIKETLHVEQTKYQHLAIVETYEFGRALVLDGIIQTTVKDEYMYHEMIALPALMTHPNPQKVMVIGGGDGGTIREVLKHPSVQQVDLVEIDEKVILACQKYLPEISCALTDSRVRIFVEDGIEYVQRHKDKYDVILIDSSDPIGPATNLFHESFYKNVYEALKTDGIMVCQSESPLFNRELLGNVHKSVKNLFPITRTYLATVPTYISGFWSFTMGSKRYDPLNAEIPLDVVNRLKTKYYNADIHKGAFVLPEYVAELFR
ncbi:polyamine aminopropyltransferase [Thermincola potens]|uniref:Polyamine aminopropyltransferase n=1 Tax=Thermincola potens (strain JR) TaxID=635013 RepID=D5X8J2_THEPJ|nr:polyamine aminopropyltransferase [Thermincola potens]ADG82868.1 spermidine synthase [Thermincola potens JR]